MRRACAAVLAVSLLGACASDTAEEASQPEPQWHVDCEDLAGGRAGDDFGDMTLPCLVGDTAVAVGPVEGRPMVISLWASWCGPCVTEAPEVQRFHELIEEHVDVVGVNTQDTREHALHFAEHFEWTFPSLVDERGEVLRTQGLTALPAILFVDEDGVTVETLTAADVTTDDLLAEAEEHFGVIL